MINLASRISLYVTIIVIVILTLVYQYNLEIGAGGIRLEKPLTNQIVVPE
jgi:hypothetical protein